MCTETAGGRVRDHMVAFGQFRYQVAEHMRRRRESVQQEDRRRGVRSRFSTEDFGSIDGGVLMSDHVELPFED